MGTRNQQRIWLVLVVLATLVWGCTQNGSEPARPAGLPSDAFWLGGPEGGVFVSLKRHEERGSTSYSGAVYHPDGSVWYKGSFVLEPASGKPVDPSDRQQFAGWDGTQLLLEDGRALVAKQVK
jgi:hypothetical protein